VRRTPQYPRAAYLAGRIVKGDVAITPLAEIPSKDPLVEVEERAMSVAGISM